MTESKKGISASQVYRMLGKKSYKTAWYLCHRIRAAMAAASNAPKLGGVVEMDETCVGGVEHGGKRGRGTNKEVVVGIRKRGGALRFFHAEDCKSGTLARYIKENISEDVEMLMTDDFAAYCKAAGDNNLEDRHKTINHSEGSYVLGDIYTNSVESAFSLLKRGIIGTWHKISAKHLQAYLDEMSFRFDNRKNRYLFRDTLLKMLEARTCRVQKVDHCGVDLFIEISDLRYVHRKITVYFYVRGLIACKWGRPNGENICFKTIIDCNVIYFFVLDELRAVG